MTSHQLSNRILNEASSSPTKCGTPRTDPWLVGWLDQTGVNEAGLNRVRHGAVCPDRST